MWFYAWQIQLYLDFMTYVEWINSTNKAKLHLWYNKTMLTVPVVQQDHAYCNMTLKENCTPQRKLIFSKFSVGVGGCLLWYVVNYPSYTIQSIKFDQNFSHCTKVISGVPPESCIRPALFCLCVNGTVECVYFKSIHLIVDCKTLCVVLGTYTAQRVPVQCVSSLLFAGITISVSLLLFY